MSDVLTQEERDELSLAKQRVLVEDHYESSSPKPLIDIIDRLAAEVARLRERSERLEAVALAEHEEFSLLHFETSSFHSQALRAAGLRIHAVRNHVVAQQEPKP